MMVRSDLSKSDVAEKMYPPTKLLMSCLLDGMLTMMPLQQWMKRTMKSSIELLLRAWTL